MPSIASPATVTMVLDFPSFLRILKETSNNNGHENAKNQPQGLPNSEQLQEDNLDKTESTQMTGIDQNVKQQSEAAPEINQSGAQDKLQSLHEELDVIILLFILK